MRGQCLRPICSNSKISLRYENSKQEIEPSLLNGIFREKEYKHSKDHTSR